MKLFNFIISLIVSPIKFINRYFKTVIFLTLLILFLNSTDQKNLENSNLQIINLYGPIMDASDILEDIKNAKNNKKIKGILLNVNSPGGAVAPSVEIYYAILELSKIKPVVAYASGIMASGSYMASVGANKIVANPGSLIGSIGVIMQSVDISKLMSTIGIKTQTVKVGRFKEAGTPTRQWTKYERDELQKITKNTYDLFVSYVAKNRNLDIKDHKTYADAHIFTATQAKNISLVDEVATLSYAKRLVEKLSKVQKPLWNKKDKIDKILQKLIEGTISNLSMHLNGLVAY